MVERSRLGRGLDFFLTDSPAAGGIEGGGGPAAGEAIAQVQIDRLIPNPDQPRREFAEAEIRELADSIRSSGILQPILARRTGEELQIVAGERRWRAAKSAGLERVPVLIRDIADDQVAVFALVENLHRADLNPIEKARAFRRIHEIAKCPMDEVARRVGLDRTTVTNFVRLLELPAEVLAHVSRGTLSMGHARALLAVRDSDTQRQLADQIIRSGLSVRAVEELVKGAKAEIEPPTVDDGGKPTKRKPSQEAWVRECIDNLAEALGAKVSIRYTKRSAKITIETRGRDEFEQLYDRLRGS